MFVTGYFRLYGEERTSAIQFHLHPASRVGRRPGSDRGKYSWFGKGEQVWNSIALHNR